MKLYENIRLKRLEYSWTQSDLAKRMGYSDKSMIAKIEAGKVDLSQTKIKAFADVFHCSPAQLMGWDDSDAQSVPTYDRNNIIIRQNDTRATTISFELYALFCELKAAIKSLAKSNR